jgi:molybdopterin converting factor small subunit
MDDNGSQAAVIELRGLSTTPEEEWRHLRRYVNLGQADLDAMAQTVEILMRRGPEFVAGAYDYLLRFPETAAILGWEQGADPVHLAERRRFFTIWLARVIGLDLSDDLARYLFMAGKYHAGHGPRRIHTPEIYVTGAISLAQASFAGYLAAEMTDAATVARALTGWNKLLTMHNHVMSAGYRVARALDDGAIGVTVTLFGRMRDLAGREKLTVRAGENGRAEQILRKFFDYYPETRGEVFNATWEDAYRLDSGGTPWLTTHHIYRARRDWNIRLNGRNVEYVGGLAAPLSDGDELSIFPPGR